MKLRYAGTCSRCGAELAAGELADYDRTSRSVACVSCGPRRGLDGPAEASEPPRRAMAAESAPLLEAVDGTAGGSAKQEYERRHDARQERVQAAHPRIGKFLLAVFDDPQTTTAWASGAMGEERLGDMLAEVAGPSLRVLHDRQVPGTKANIDHLVVCPSGVFVVDAKRYRGQRPELRIEGGIIRPREELLIIGGRNRTPLVDGMHKQVGLVRQVLADEPEVPVRGVLCFVEADWPLIGGAFTVQGVNVLWMKKLKALLAEPGPLGPDEIAELQWRLHEALPRKV
ncbi:nuclease-like protein [Propionicimonas paludicola]|uniref:Nuclease-like protein n=1 Tax=Propionicimonas paludicola TaxID=185243 RepID=A0A2A9CUB4_9ACTN|nr:nuclease-related domain-containing protein [Propionicimonas paludicola]PFG17149.1 nuclease-like protein [Propionicimonas paludicola]